MSTLKLKLKFLKASNVLFIVFLSFFASINYGCNEDGGDAPVPEVARAAFEYQVDEDNPLRILFTNRSENFMSVHWDFGDGQTSEDANPVHTYSSEGSFDITLTVSNNSGEDEFMETVVLDITLQYHVEKYLEDKRAEFGIKGFGYTILTPTESIELGLVGEGNNGPLDPDKVWHTTSNTQVLTAALIMLHAETGFIDLDNPIKEYGIQYSNINGDYTVRELMGHNTDFFDFMDHSDLDNDLENDLTKVWTVDDVLNNYILSPVPNPDKNYVFNNTNYILLGKILENITHQSIATLASQMVFDELGLEKTQMITQSFDASNLNGQWGAPGNGTKDRNDWAVNSRLTFWGGAGSMVSTTHELAILLKNLMIPGVLTQSSIDVMLSSSKNSQVVFRDWIFEGGHGFQLGSYKGHSVQGGGGTGLHKIIALFSPENDVFIVLAYNHEDFENIKRLDMFGDIFELVLDEIN